MQPGSYGARGANLRLPPPPSSAGGASRERQVGTLRITCERAERLPSRADAFMRVRIGTEDRRTRAVSQSFNPKWNEPFELKGRLLDFLRPLNVSLLDEARRQRGQPLVLGELPPIDLRQIRTNLEMDSHEEKLHNMVKKTKMVS